MGEQPGMRPTACSVMPVWAAWVVRKASMVRCVCVLFALHDEYLASASGLATARSCGPPSDSGALIVMTVPPTIVHTFVPHARWCSRECIGRNRILCRGSQCRVSPVTNFLLTRSNDSENGDVLRRQTFHFICLHSCLSAGRALDFLETERCPYAETACRTRAVDVPMRDRGIGVHKWRV